MSGVALVAAALLIVAWDLRVPAPGPWELGAFLLISILLDQTSTSLRMEAKGTTSFIIHLAAGILFGAFWAAAIGSVSIMLVLMGQKNPPIKIVFNAGQRVIAIVLGSLAYQLLGGSIPPAYLQAAGSLSSEAVQRDFGLFFLFAIIYFSINSAAVSGAISLSSNRSFSEVWRVNTRGVLGYDLGASAIAILMAWLFTFSKEHWNFGALGIIGVVLPIWFVRKIYSMYRNLEATSQELLEVMVKAIEARDPYTSGHSERVARLSRMIAHEIGGMNTEEIEKIYKAALLHDVGKMYEEFAPLLRKETKLTQEERELLQTHAIRSAELVAIVSDFKGTVLESVRSHHERWDGRGYPDGIGAESIPLGARIIMISDTIDAMTTDRPYRKALGVDVVIAELQKHRATQFDPK
ncbi:MAG: HD-GYP domain-containing protein, partial [Gemmatimonadales bacterium]